MKCRDQVFLFLTNKSSIKIVRSYKEIKKGTKKFGDAYYLYHQKEYLPGNLKDISVSIFTYEILNNLGYTSLRRSLIPGSNHFPILNFYLSNPNYQYYWCIEDDVLFNGNWQYLFSSFKDFQHDFLSSHLRSFNDEHKWCWWNSLKHPTKKISEINMIRSFNPIYRISNKALNYIHNCLIDGWSGHHEVLFPTLLSEGSFSLLDFGGLGKYTLSGYENKFYTSCNPNPYGELTNGTLRYRPCWEKPKNKDNKLYHPLSL